MDDISSFNTKRAADFRDRAAKAHIAAVRDAYLEIAAIFEKRAAESSRERGTMPEEGSE